MSEIIKRGEKRYLVRVFLRRVNGRTKYHNKVVHGTLKQAQKYARESEAKRDLGILDKPAKEDPEFGKFLDAWMKEFKKGSVKERTFEGYEYIIKQYIKPYLGKKRLSELTARVIQSSYNEMSEAELSPRTIAFAHSLIREALNQAVIDDLLVANPALPTRRPARKKKAIAVFTPAEADRFIKEAKKDSQGIAFWFALAVGARPEEYLALQWSDLDLDKAEANIHRSIYFPKGGEWKIEEVKTDSSLRRINFSSVLASALSEHKKKQLEWKLKRGKKYENNNLVFATPRGTPLHLRNLTLRHLVPIMERAKIDGPRNLYRLRHSFATLSLVAGIEIKIVSKQMGHSSVSFTMDTYQHVIPSMRQDAAEKIGKILFGAV